jgi:hypothetical protein
MSLIGTLGEIPLADVLRLFATGRKTGLLTVAAGGREALVRLYHGAVVHAVCGRLSGDAAILDLFGWSEGQLSFVPDDKSVEANVTRPVEALIEMGVREGALFHRMTAFFSSDRLVFQMAPRPPESTQVTLGAPEWAVLRALDGQREFHEVLLAAGVGRAAAQRVLFTLTEAGFLEKLELHRTLRAQAQGRFGAAAAEVEERLEGEWRKSMRFAEGVLRVEVQAGRDRTTTLGVAFRPSLVRTIVLPRAAFAELGLREGDDVSVRPAG